MTSDTSIQQARNRLNDTIAEHGFGKEYNQALDAYNLAVESLHASQIQGLQKELRITDELLADTRRVLYTVPECKLHGPSCIPHAVEWIKAHVDKAGSK